jgi:predicted enzyme related to lactoylglutathione lyase
MEFSNGQPCWVDVMVADAGKQKALTAFLTDLFGLRWEVGGPETGFYAMGFVGDGAVMAVGRNEQGAGQFVTYLHCDDIAATAAAVAQAGGQVFMGPMQVMDAGSMALAMDAAGAVFGLWQGNLMKGFGAFDVPGAFTWFDLMSTDPAKASHFYAAAFGLESSSAGDMMPGYMLGRGGQFVASVSQADAGSSSFWNPILTVVNLDDTETKATALGCHVIMHRMKVPGGEASAVHHPALGITIVFFQPMES